MGMNLGRDEILNPGKNPMKNWQAAIRTWEAGTNAGNKQNLPPAAPPPPPKPEDLPTPMPEDVKNALKNLKIGGASIKL
jgi:hypothetical protein